MGQLLFTVKMPYGGRKLTSESKGFLDSHSTPIKSAQSMTQLSNLWWMPSSDNIGFGQTGSSRQFKRYPTTFMWVLSWLPFTVDLGLFWFILIHSKGKPTWNSDIGCGVSFELLMSSFSRQGPNLCRISLAFIIDWRIVIGKLKIRVLTLSLVQYKLNQIADAHQHSEDIDLDGG